MSFGWKVISKSFVYLRIFRMKMDRSIEVFFVGISIGIDVDVFVVVETEFATAIQSRHVTEKSLKFLRFNGTREFF